MGAPRCGGDLVYLWEMAPVVRPSVPDSLPPCEVSDPVIHCSLVSLHRSQHRSPGRIATAPIPRVESS
jgi:hypothetical protein